MLIKAMQLVAELTAAECLDTYETTVDPMVRSVCGWRLLSSEDFTRLLALVDTPVEARAAAATPAAVAVAAERATPVRRSRERGSVPRQVLRLLPERERWSTDELAAKCGCLPATVRCAIWTLRKEGHVIDGPFGGGYHLSIPTAGR